MTLAAVGPQEAADDDRTRRDKQVRWWTRAFRVLPDFLIIGGMRCGTTSLYAYLSEHPQVLPAAKKELHFFDRRFDHGLGWYRARFPLVTAKVWHRIRSGHRAVTGEATPFYLYHPASAARIAEILPEAKLIALLRNPVDRAYSHYHMSVGGRHERLSFEEAVRKEDARLRAKQDRSDPYLSKAYRHYSYVARGIYVDQLKAYEAYASRGQLLVVKSEDLFEKTQETYDQVLAFLGLEPWQLRSIEPRHAGAYPKDAKPPGYEELREFFAPRNRRLYEYLGRDLGW